MAFSKRGEAFLKDLKLENLMSVMHSKTLLEFTKKIEKGFSTICSSHVVVVEDNKVEV